MSSKVPCEIGTGADSDYGRKFSEMKKGLISEQKQQKNLFQRTDEQEKAYGFLVGSVRASCILVVVLQVLHSSTNPAQSRVFGLERGCRRGSGGSGCGAIELRAYR
jgi:hypothetical protein